LCWFHSPVCFSVNIQSLLLVNKITYQAFSFSIKPTGQHHSLITSWCPALKKCKCVIYYIIYKFKNPIDYT
jgi:hypothetical protein